MSKFTDTVNQDTPRLVVMYQMVNGKEQFKWGAVGAIPTLSLIGAIIRVQMELFTTAGEECPEPALVIAWDMATRRFEWFVHPSIPIEALVGMLEAVKITVMNGQQGSGKPAQGILGPDGMPMIR